MIADDTTGEQTPAMLEQLEGFLSHKSEMVIYEAARAIVNIPSASTRELSRAISGVCLDIHDR